jgi:hypothetical protein
MQHDWVDWLGAIGGFVAGTGALVAVVVALWIATHDRHDSLAREERERKIQAAERRIAEALVVLEAWETSWAFHPKPSDPPSEDEWAWRRTPEFRVAVAHLTTVLRASGEPFIYARSGFRHFGFDDAYGQQYLSQEHDLGVAGTFPVFDPESEDDDRRIIRMEILEVIADARRQIVSHD